MIEPTHRADGRELSREDRDPPAFIGCVDEPNSTDVATDGSPFCRFGGWVASTRGRPLRVLARVGDDPPLEFPVARARPDVVEVLGAPYGFSDPVCGFRFDVEVPGDAGDEVPVALEFTDGEFVATIPAFRIRRTEDARPARADYKAVWNSVSDDVEHAKLAVAGYTDEDEFEQMAHATVSALRETVGLSTDDVVLEIGAGVGRVGSVLAPLCKKWIATDVSENMLRHTRERLAGLDNVETVPTNGWDLQPIPSESVDLVYCTIVFMHLDEWERFNYVREGLRVLRPGGRMYVDNTNLLGDDGWAFFMHALDEHHPLGRPPNISKSSTPQELETYFQRAGFDDVKVRTSSMWVTAYGRKPKG
ncbi:MAG: class I SAM-dependent methyltransferase [Acidimicrobiia bacterium]